MKTVCIIQARLDSERLPNKILLQLPPGSGVSMLELVIRKALLATRIDEVIVVTPDKELMKICHFCGVRTYVKFFEGRDVLREYYKAAYTENASLIVRLTADCPMIMPETIDEIVENFLDGEVDIVFNTDCADGDMTGDGFDVECFSYDALVQAHHNAVGIEREHVTTWMRKNLRAKRIPPCKREGRSVNTLEDYRVVCGLIEKEQTNC